MSISSEFNRISGDRDTIRTKLIELGMASASDNLDKLATAIEGIVNVGAVSVTVKEGDTYTIPRGYHNGSGTVSGTAGGGNYTLQEKTVTPTKKQQSVTAASGFYGLSSVTVNAIPDAYQNVSSTTATAGDVLTGKVFVAANGDIITGNMINNGDVEQTLSATSITYTIPKGYHGGKGTVSISLETKTATPTKSIQNITPSVGKVLSKVTVNPIPSNYITTNDANATQGDIIDSKTAYVNGVKVTGSRPITNVNKSILQAPTYDDIDRTVVCETTAGSDIAMNSTNTIKLEYKSDLFGNATAADVASGKTFTAADGVAIEGTNTKDSNTSDGTALATDIANGKVAYSKGKRIVGTSKAKDSSDATAVAAEIADGKTAYVNNVKVTGTVHVIDLDSHDDAEGVSYIDVGKKIDLVDNGATYPVMYKSNIKKHIQADASLFGNVAAANVLAGQKFTSVNGLNISGSMPNNGSTSKQMDGITTTSVTVPAGYTSGGTISLTSDIEDLLASI